MDVWILEKERLDAKNDKIENQYLGKDIINGGSNRM